jgi:hypothetical protein
MNQAKQIEIMEGQLKHFDSLMEKVQYLNAFFDPDPDFSQAARDIVRSNLCKEIKNLA